MLWKKVSTVVWFLAMKRRQERHRLRKRQEALTAAELYVRYCHLPVYEPVLMLCALVLLSLGARY